MMEEVEIEHEIKGLEEALVVMKARLDAAGAEADDEEQQLRDNTRINTALLHQRAAAATRDQPTTTPSPPSPEAVDTILAAEEHRNAQAKAKNARLKKGLARFLARYYPPPAPAPAPAGNEDGDSEGGRSLGMVVLEMMNRRATAASEDAQYTESSTIWPPHAELLLRAGVAEKHPTDSSRLRIADLS
jgi:centromere protein K